jgi:hypothetical protein
MNLRQVSTNLYWGARWGGFLGAVFMLFAVVVLLFKGPNPDGISLILILGAYPASGVLAGLIVGLLRPVLVSRSSAMAVGMIAAVPVSILFLRIVKGPFSGWGALGWVASILGAAWIGGLGGYVWWSHFSSFDSSLFARPSPEAGLKRKQSRARRAERGRRKK